MKKITQGQRRLWAHRRRRQLNRWRKLRARRLAASQGVTYAAPPAPPPEFAAPRAVRNIRKRAALKAELPMVMSLRANRDPTLEVYRTIRRAIRKRRRLELDFTTLRQITPAAALVLAAEIDRWRRMAGVRPIVLEVENWQPDMVRLFHDMGFFDLVEAANPPTINPSVNATERFLRYRYGVGALGDEAVQLRAEIEALTGMDLPGRREMYRGVTEAMTNVHKHAYFGRVHDGTPYLPNAWWMGGGFEIASRRLRVLVYDQGVGIPTTLPRNYSERSIREVIFGKQREDTDASRIAAAMELGRTRTGLSNQGKGLPDFQRFINAADVSELRILSLRGEYLYSKGSPEQLIEHDRRLGGTLISWEIVL